jgi:hypothetical protein
MATALSHLKSMDTLRLGTPIIIGVILAISVLMAGFYGKKTNFDELALGKETHAQYASLDGIPIHCKHLEDAHLCLEGVQQRNLSKSGLWLGNSQVHAVNQFQSGQENAPPILFRLLQKIDIDLITFSQPNASLQEHYVLFEYLKKRLPVQFLILPVVFDDLRENTLRLEIAQALADADTNTALAQTDIGRIILAEHGDLTDVNKDMAALKNTIQEHSETTLNNWLDKHSSLWALRSEIRGTLLTYIHVLRNTVFGIKATSKRRVIQGRYLANMAALSAIIESAKASNINILLYIVPLRNDVDIPYVAEEYNSFKKEIKQLAINKEIKFTNLENLVPGQLWGLKGSTTLGGDEQELDFMHFQAVGHQLLANALYQAIHQQIISQP